MSFPYYSNAYQDEFDRDLNHPVPNDLLVVTRNGERLKAPAEFQNDPKLKALAAKERSNAVHPAQLYSTITGLLIMSLCLAYITVPHVPGRVFALMLLTEGPTRFLLELLRVEPPVWQQLGMSLSMIIGVILFVIGVVLWIGFGMYAKKSQPAGMPLSAVPV